MTYLLPARAFLLAAVLFGTPAAPAQAPAAPSTTPLPKPQFFAGVVSEMDATHITISRTLVGRAPESRTFVINSATKINRTAVKVKTKVTVRYRRLAEGDVALEIQLRPLVRTPKPA
jgi:hypothetical protein